MSPTGPRLLLVVLIAAQLAACSSGAPVAAPAPAVEPPLAEAQADAAVASPALAAPLPAVAPAAAPARPMAAGKVAHEMARRAVMPTLMPAPMPMPVPDQPSNERYGQISDNPIHRVAEAPVSTFSVDVDTGSYSNVRRLLNGGALPPADAVRVEELINYFPYDYALPRDGRPFAVHTALAPAPWNAQRVLLRVAIKGQDVAQQSLPPANLVFLVDVSGSMESADKLPLLRSSLKLLVDQMRPVDRISLVTYAGSTQVVLPSTSGADKAAIKAAIDALRAGGSTAGASGIELAYRAAQQSFIDGGINRILLATDGDFNVGVSDTEQLKKMVEAQRRTGISLSTLGFGTGNYNEQLMEQIADVGDGAYSYVDNLMEGQKVLVSEMSSTLATIARDVKVQIEFNPALVQEYRQIGYENRQLRREDFHNDQVDAGDIGAGHTVTALYELTLTGARGAIDPLRYGAASSAGAANTTELAHLRLRYKRPGQSSSELIETPIRREAMKPLDQTDADFRFATAVAGFGQVLRGGRHTGGWTVTDARALAAGSVGEDRFGYRGEFLRLAGLAQALAK
jgi:Ca-activated chloride channel family protein